MEKLLKSFGHACDGFFVAWREGLNFKIGLFCAGAAIALGFFLHLSSGELSAVFLTGGFVLSVEILNTALEELCDKFRSAYDPHIKKIKDLGAGAALVSVIAAIGVGIIIFGPHLLSLLNA